MSDRLPRFRLAIREDLPLSIDTVAALEEAMAERIALWEKMCKDPTLSEPVRAIFQRRRADVQPAPGVAKWRWP